MSKYLETKKGSLESAVLEAVSRAQQAAIAIAKKEKGEKPKNEEKTECPQCEGKGCDHCGGKGYHTTEELTAKQKKLDVDKDGDIGADDLAALRKKAKKEETELDEDMVSSLAKEFEKRVKKQGYSSKTQDRERMAVLGMAKKKGASPDDMKKLDKAIVGIINKLDEVKEEKDMSEMCCKNCGDMFGKPTAESSCTYDAYDPMGENWIKKENYKEEYSLVEKAAEHISDMWKDAAKVKKEADDKREKAEQDGTTMTGKPMSKVKVAPAEAEKEG